MTYNQIMYQNYVENRRSNLAKEQETGRSNLAQEGLKLQELTEVNRHNLATEQESGRHNIATEQNEATKAQNSYLLGVKQAELNAKVAAETARHNAVSESNQLALGYLNSATSQRIAAANRVSNEAIASANRTSNESIQSDRLNLDSAKLTEQQRHNTAQENSTIKGAIGSLISGIKTRPQKGLTNENARPEKIKPQTKPEPRKISAPVKTGYKIKTK